MGDALVATVVVVLLLSAGLAVLVGLTVVPFVRAVDLAERRGASPAWAGALTLATIGAGLLLALLVLRSDLPTPLVLVPLLLCWAVPVALTAGAAAGSRGAHE